MKKVHIFAAAVAATACLFQPASATEPAKLKFAYLQVIDLIPYFIADSKGYFKDEGLEVEPIVLTGGPAIISAVGSGSADIGFTGSVSLVNAHLKGLKFKFFSGLNFEKAPDDHVLVFVGREKSGVKSIKDLKGKVIAFNTFGGQCELIARVQLEKAGIAEKDVKFTTLPFPQMPAAISTGNIDAACTTDPFLTQMRHNKIGPVVMSGLVLERDIKTPHLNSGIFASDEWLTKNKDKAIRFRKALQRGVDVLKSNPSEARDILTKYTKLTPELAKEAKFVVYMTDIPASSVQAIVDAQYSTGMIKTKFDAKQIVESLK
ncbi:ABC transporter substrate-binding protein [Pseudolabrys sp.]|uniref:ABC transporter substrate-binding protein n=1 Tax=Pseudolabrys sp. TaxID=1960880 RepID=UPI003D0D8C2E